MTWEMGLDYVNALAWPLVTLALCMVFRAQLRAALTRLTSLNTPLGGASFDTSAEQALSVANAPSQGPDFASLHRLVAASPPTAVSEAFQQGYLSLQRARGEHASDAERLGEIEALVTLLDQERLRLLAGAERLTHRNAADYVQVVERAHAAAVRSANSPLPGFSAGRGAAEQTQLDA
ncbi:hypothetical protein [Streptomyces iconiensis]|uniref:Uncharacterized protein n=1 Tax=Streptomyces iconiensis TaxID=1384038 RepID=A0ABT7ABA5_9ACTN|nr:hypothetical protein [Streptomyces iconiensis]MDJ1138279.1 hypothetical protein [Streptomyces iconiensis]